MKSSISEKGQVTIPKALRDRAGLSPGAEVRFEATPGMVLQPGMIVMVKVVLSDAIELWRGKAKLPRGSSSDEYLRLTRGE